MGFLDSMNSTFDLASYMFKFKYVESCIKLTLNFAKMDRVETKSMKRGEFDFA